MINKKRIPVYFIGNRKEKKVKIGKSNCPEKRLKNIQSCCPFELNILLITRFFSEKELHKMFENYRSNNEWFVLTEDLIEFIQIVNIMEKLNKCFEQNENITKEDFSLKLNEYLEENNSIK